MIAEHYRWNGGIASHLKGFGNFLFSKFFGNSIDEITDGRGFEPLLFHFQGDFCSQSPFSEGCGDIRNLSFVPESWRQIQGQIVLHQMLYVHITPFHIFYAIKFVKNWWIKARNRIDFSIYACIIESKAEYLGFSHSRKVEHFTRKNPRRTHG